MTQAPATTQVAAVPAAVSPTTGRKDLDDAAASGVAAAAGALPARDVAETAVAPVPIDPLRPDVRLDLDDRSTRVDLWDRVRRGFAMTDLDSDLVRERERWYASRPDYVARMTERGGRYLFYIVEELDKRHMPTELALLPFIESAYNPQAKSVASAAGMWQFIPSTGRDFELRQNIFRDDRRSVLDSTRAALDYLQKLHGMFGDWHLALAAYNWGEGSVQRAMAKNQRAGLPTDYQSLRMPLETQGYVPKLQAVKNIIARPADFNLKLPELFNHPYFLSVPIERDIDVAIAVKLSGIQSEEFQNLNPQMNRPVILAAGTPQVLLPYDNANRFIRELPKHRGPLASWTAWVAPRTMKTADAAQSVGVSEEHLRDINHIPARMMIKAGSTLLVPRGNSLLADVSSKVADNATMTLSPDIPPLRKVSLRAGRRDSVSSVARRYRVSGAQVAQWNDVGPNAKFKPGQSIVVYVKQTPRGEGRTTTAAVSVPSTKTHLVGTRMTREHGSRSGPTPTGHVKAAKAKTTKSTPRTATSSTTSGRVKHR
ncbi:MAG: transglycosylase SLT domain-containing protein [Caldimonas sp.]